MAQVDFTNARIAPYGTKNPTEYSYVNMSQGTLYDANGNSVCTNIGYTITKNVQKQLVIIFSGTFTTSGTQFFVQSTYNSNCPWKVSNISFNNGDTYVFSIKADLICQ